MDMDKMKMRQKTISKLQKQKVQNAANSHLDQSEVRQLTPGLPMGEALALEVKRGNIKPGARIVSITLPDGTVIRPNSIE